MRRSVGLLAVVVAVRVAAAAPPPPPAPPASTVPLPCESSWQRVLATGQLMLVGCKDSIRLVELPSGKARGSWKSGQLVSVRSSLDGSTLAISERGKVRIYRTRDAKLVGEVTVGARYLSMFQPSPDGKLLVVAPVTRPPEVWAVSGKPKRLATLQTEFGSAGAAAWSADGSRLAVATDDTAVRVYDTSSWKVTAEVTGQPVLTLALAWSADGKRIALGLAGGRIAIADTAGKITQTFPVRREIINELGFVGDRVFAVHFAQAGGPPELVRWSLDGKPSPITDTRPISGGGIVDGALWLVAATKDSAQLWAP